MDSMQRKDERKSITHIECAIYCIKILTNTIYRYIILQKLLFFLFTCRKLNFVPAWAGSKTFRQKPAKKQEYKVALII